MEPPFLNRKRRIFKYRAVPIDSGLAIQPTIIEVSSRAYRASAISFKQSVLPRYAPKDELELRDQMRCF